MMIYAVLLTGLSSAVLVFVSGYMFGAHRGLEARRALGAETLRLGQEVEILTQRLHDEWRDNEEGLRAAIERALVVLAERDRDALPLKLSDLKQGEGRNLTALLDMIAEAGDFDSVVLSDSEGLALAANARASEVERIAATSALVQTMVDKAATAGRAPASSAMLQNDSGRTLIFRLFSAQDQRLVLATSGSNARATPGSLDAAVARIVELLSA